MGASDALTFFAYFFLGIGPGVAFFISVIAFKSFLVILSIFSCFLWLSVLLVISGIFRGFYPIEPSVGAYAGVLAASVFIEEAVRYGVWRIHKKAVYYLDDMARKSGHRFNLIDKLYIALAWGYGHAACHVIFFFLSMLPLTTMDGTFYTQACPQMSMFLMGALYSLAFGMLLTSMMVVTLDGYHRGNWAHILYAPVLHFGAAFLTLLNLRQDGCMISVPILMAAGVSSVLYTLYVCWRQGTRTVLESPPPGSTGGELAMHED